MPRLSGAILLVNSLLVACVLACAPAVTHADPLRKVDHIVVIYQENHSFDNLYGGWSEVGGQHVNGLADATPARNIQLAQDGSPLRCLYQDDVNLTSPSPLPTTCTDTAHPARGGTTATPRPVRSAFANKPWRIDEVITATATTCSTSGGSDDVRAGTGAPGGCTHDLVHRFYQEQYQIDGGKQDRYVTGSDAVGLTMGHYDTTQLPIYAYLHSNNAPPYVIADNFFQGAFGGSFLNHQVLVAAQAPVFPSADRSGQATGCTSGTAHCDLHSAVDANGMPTSYPYYTPPAGIVKDQQLTEAADSSGRCASSFPKAVPAPAGTLCGDYAINTIQPFTQPYAPGTMVGERLPLLHSPNIGDSLSARAVSWAWYSGGWDNAAGNNGHDATHPLGAGWTAGPTGTAAGTCTEPVATNAVFPYCPDPLFQFHHQPLSYFTHFADGTPGRAQHLLDEQQFLRDVARPGGLPAVSFVKPIGAENEHPSYANETSGSSHLVETIKAIINGPDAQHTVIIITYDEFGGQWDHVSPPGTPGNPGPHDAFGPGTRIPTLIISPDLRSGVDHTQHDTTSILATIEHRFGLPPLTGPDGKPARDARVADLFTALR
ncbi:MAG: alkaline phosphatase family protein [Pseudonocardiaceae bacterium]